MEVTLDIEDITSKMKAVAKRAIKEEDVKIGIESILKDVSTKLGLSPASYEYTFVTGGRADALYGQVIIEYEAPESLQGKTKRESSIAQLKEYISKHAKSEENYHKHLGISIDGQNILFVRYNYRDKDWIIHGPFPINVETVGRLLEALRGLKRKALDVDIMLLDFGPNSDTAKKVIQQLYNSPMQSSRSKVLFDDWRRVFKQVAAYSPEKVEGLETVYEISGKIDYEKLLFSIHTYYAFLMKLIAAEVVVLYGGGKFVRSYISELLEAQLSGKLKNKLTEIEEGTVFRKFLNLENFMEADYFSWYIDEWSDELSKALGNVIKSLSDYEVGTTDLEPERVRDLFKRLYQNLMPKKIRHDMGEYYTPDWLAELLLDEVGFKTINFEQISQKEKDELAPLKQRLLDPACGSGTFLVLAIKRIKDYADQHYVDAALLVKHILTNIVGFDLNPLAVIAARTNYLLALGDLLRFVATKIEIPIFLADSIMVERRGTLTGESYILRTAVDEFQIPISLVEKATLTKVLDAISRYVNLEYAPKEFETIIKSEISNLDDNELSFIIELFRKFKILEREGKNRIWTGVIKNSFAPLYQGKFDYIIGNPPWILWDSLPDNYRNATKDLWIYYGLFTLSGMEARLGGGKKDISILFTYRCIDKYLKDDGLFGFVITQSVFKTKGAGEGFRKFSLRGTPLHIIKVHDMVSIRPFEGASNRTAMILLEKGKKTKYPVPYEVWLGRAVNTSATLKELVKSVQRVNMEAIPSDRTRLTSAWINLPNSEIYHKISGNSFYEAYEGINSGGANGVYWLQPIGISSKPKRALQIPSHLNKIFTRPAINNELVIQNITEGMKKEIEPVKDIVEDFLLYPLLKSKHLRKWKTVGYIYMLQTQDPINRHGYDESWMKINLPKTYSYLKKFECVLVKRALFRKYFGENNYPFYTIFNVATHLFSPYKVVWNQMGNKLNASVISTVNDKYVGNKPLLPEHVLAYIPTNDEMEAHYICAILNSNIAKLILSSIARGTKSFGTPNFINERIKILRYDPDNHLQKELSRLSKLAHKYAINDDTTRLAEIEKKIDQTVGELYTLSKHEMEIVKKSLSIIVGNNKACQE